MALWSASAPPSKWMGSGMRRGYLAFLRDRAVREVDRKPPPAFVPQNERVGLGIDAHFLDVHVLDILLLARVVFGLVDLERPELGAAADLDRGNDASTPARWTSSRREAMASSEAPRCCRRHRSMDSAPSRLPGWGTTLAHLSGHF